MIDGWCGKKEIYWVGWRDARICKKLIFALVAHTVENIDTPCNACIDLENVNDRTKKMAMGKQLMRLSSQVRF